MILNGIKRSGESLCVGGRPGQAWTQEGRDLTVAHLGDLAAYLGEQNARNCADGVPLVGAIVVIGAGNGGFRGTELAADGMDRVVADQIGLTGTVLNALVVHDDLTKAGVPHRALLAAGVELKLPGMNRWDVCSSEAIAEAVEAGLPALIGGGSAELGQSTDAATMDHLGIFRDATGAEVRAYKATKPNGVHAGDPDIVPDAPLLPSVTTQTMRDKGWDAVDNVCLDLIDHYGIPMFAHNMRIPPAEALRGCVGTIILPHAVSVPA